MNFDVPLPTNNGFFIYTRTGCCNCDNLHELLDKYIDKDTLLFKIVKYCNVDELFKENRKLLKEKLIEYILNGKSLTITDRVDDVVLTGTFYLSRCCKYNQTDIERSLSYPVMFYNGTFINSPFTFIHELSDFEDFNNYEFS